MIPNPVEKMVFQNQIRKCMVFESELLVSILYKNYRLFLRFYFIGTRPKDQLSGVLSAILLTLFPMVTAARHPFEWCLPPEFRERERESAVGKVKTMEVQVISRKGKNSISLPSFSLNFFRASAMEVQVILYFQFSYRASNSLLANKI